MTRTAIAITVLTLVTTGEILVKDYLRTYSSLGAEQQMTVEVFRDPSDAMRWLDTAGHPSSE